MEIYQKIKYILELLRCTFLLSAIIWQTSEHTYNQKWSKFKQQLKVQHLNGIQEQKKENKRLIFIENSKFIRKIQDFNIWTFTLSPNHHPFQISLLI